MAKIYQTEADIQRDAATQQRGRATFLASNSMIVTGFGLGWLINNLWKGKSKSSESLLLESKLMAGITVVLGALGIVFGFKKSQEAGEVLNKLGSEKIIGPCCAEDYLQTKSNHAEGLVAQQNTMPPKSL